MALFEATEVTLEPGVYRAKLKTVEESTWLGYNSGQEEPCIRWVFEITEEGSEDQSIDAKSSTAFGPNSKARAWSEALLARKIEAGEKLDPPDLLGKECDLSVKLVEKERGTYANIESVNPVRKKSRKAEKEQSKQVRDVIQGRQPVADSPNDEDIEDIPF